MGAEVGGGPNPCLRVAQARPRGGWAGLVGRGERVALEGRGFEACEGVDADGVSAGDVEGVGVASTPCIGEGVRAMGVGVGVGVGGGPEPCPWVA